MVLLRIFSVIVAGLGLCHSFKLFRTRPTFVRVLSTTNALFETKEKALTKRDRNVDGLLESMKHIRGKDFVQVALQEDPLVPMVEVAVKAADMRKAASVVALRVAHLTDTTQFIILIEGFNNRQNQAIAIAIEVRLDHENIRLK